MADDSRVQQLLDQLLDPRATPEQVCAACPELLPVVRKRWRQMRRLRADLDALFPPPDVPSTKVDAPSPPEPTPQPRGMGLPRIPGYEVEAVLGRGGMGVVFRARHLRLNRLVALKMLLGGEYAGSHERARLQREAEAVAGLRHENIVRVYDVGEHEGQPYFTMEFVEGGSLAQKLDGAPQPVRQAARLVATLAEAVRVAHQGGVVHRDLKPGNVLLTADGTPKVSDFGLARRLQGGTALTQSGVPMGTPSYMAPEQARGQVHGIGPAVDVYALGAILYELLTGRPPFRGTTAAETLRQVIDQDPVPPSRLNAEVPRDLETVCLKCLQKAPQHRYATALALAEDLGRYQRGEPIAARPVSRAERVARWVRRKPAAAALVLAALALTGFGVAAGASKWRLEAKRRAAAAEWAPRLEFVEQCLRDGRFAEARAVLQHRPDADVGEVNDRIAVALTQLDLAQNLDRIRVNRVAVVDGRFDPDANRARSDREYEAAFGEAGVGGFSDTPSAAAARVRESPIRAVLVAALDDWASCKNDASRRGWILEVARHADPDPTGWRDRVRSPSPSREALAELAQTAVVKEQSVQLLVALAQKLQATGADPTAFLRRVQQQYPGDFWACFTLAEALWIRNPEECIRYYQAALAIRPDTAVAHHNVGRALAIVNRLDDATDHFREAIRLEPKYAHAISNLGKALSTKGRNPEALDLMRQAIAIDENSARLHNNLAILLSAIGRDEEALDEYRRMVALEPNFAIGRVTYANRLRGLRRYDEAMEQLEYARRIDPNSGWVPLMIGQVRHNQKRIDDAMAEFETALRLDASLHGAHMVLGDLWWREKQSPRKALLEYDKALALRPDDADTIKRRRIVQVQLGLGEEVRAAWAETLRAQPETLKGKPSQQEAWCNYAELCLYLGRQDEYERSCHELLGQIESSDAPLAWERSRACMLGVLGHDDTARAVALMDRVIKAEQLRSPAAYYPWIPLAQALARYRLGDFDGAIRTIEVRAATEQDWSSRYLVLSMAQRRAGRADEAFRSLATATRLYDSDDGRESIDASWFEATLRREMESVVMPNLPALLAGQEKPRNRDERLALIAICHARRRTEMASSLLDAELADLGRRPLDQGQRLVLIGICRSMQRTVAVARLSMDAFAVDPALANRLILGHRYYAGCCAARAGSGDGADAANLNEEGRARCRDQARVWLCDDLVAKRALLAGAPTEERRQLPGTLEIWFRDPDLACVREDGKLRKLPPAEQEAWHELWRDARSLLAEARSPNSKASP